MSQKRRKPRWPAVMKRQRCSIGSSCPTCPAATCPLKPCNVWVSLAWQCQAIDGMASDVIAVLPWQIAWPLACCPWSCKASQQTISRHCRSWGARRPAGAAVFVFPPATYCSVAETTECSNGTIFPVCLGESCTRHSQPCAS